LLKPLAVLDLSWSCSFDPAVAAAGVISHAAAPAESAAPICIPQNLLAKP
jgi:hypothetical protein